MKVLWINHRDPKHPQAGGAEVRIHEIGKRLVQKGHSVKLICENWPGCKRHEFLDGIDIVRPPLSGRYTIHLITPFLLNRFSDYDIVIDDIAHAIPWESEFFTNKPVIGQIHHVHQEVLDFEINPILAKGIALSERSIKSYKALIAVSESTKNALIDLGVSKNIIKVIPNGINADFYRPTAKSSLPTLLWVGRVKRYKRVDHVLLAFSIVQKQLPDAKLIIVGMGDDLERIKCMAERLGLTNICFPGFVSEKVKAQLMASCWVVTSTSYVEGWGMTITECGASGTPAVAYNVPGLRDSVQNGETGLLVRDGDIEALAKAMLKVLQNVQLRVTLGENALRWTRKLNWDKISDEFSCFLESVRDGRSVKR